MHIAHRHPHRRLLTILLVLTIGTVVLASCGQTIAGAPLSSSAVPGSWSRTPTSTAWRGAGLQPPGQTIMGQVTLTPNQSSFSSGNPIVVTIHNGLSTPISAADHQSNCTVLTLQVRANGTWETVSRCQLMTETHEVLFTAGSATPVQLGLAGETGAPDRLPPGTYRALLICTLGPYTPSSPGSSVTIQTETFTLA